MSTHGNILVQGENKKDKINLYAYHDGHSLDALRHFLAMPFDLFTASKFVQGPDRECLPAGEDGHDLFTGPWFYDIHSPKGSIRKAASRADLLRAWKSGKPLDINHLSVAHWLIWRRFDVWNAVPDKSYWSWADEFDLVVTVQDDVGYKIEDRRRDDEDKQTDKFIHALNRKVRSRAARIKRDKNTYAVPVLEILIDLLWYEDR